MAERVANRSVRKPAERLRGPGDGYFFPGEVRAMLGLGDIDYQQMRRLFSLIREQAGSSTEDGWSRYSLTDVAALKVLVELCGGTDALAPNRRLRIECVRRACLALRDLGVDNPLLDVPMERSGNRVFVVLRGSIVDPVNGQTALGEAYRLARQSLRAEPGTPELTGRLGAERRRKSPTQRNALKGQNAQLSIQEIRPDGVE